MTSIPIFSHPTNGLFLFVLMWLAACSGMSSAEREAHQAREARQGTGADCIRMRQMRGFDVVDQENLIVETRGRGNVYHLRLQSACHGLQYGRQRAMLHTRDGRLCGGAGDSVIVGGAIGQVTQQCHISRVRRIDEAGAREMLARRDADRSTVPAGGKAEVKIPADAPDGSE